MGKVLNYESFEEIRPIPWWLFWVSEKEIEEREKLGVFVEKDLKKKRIHD